MSHRPHYLILDPSVFVSVRKLEEISRLLTDLSQPKIDSKESISVVVPTDLYKVLYSIIEGKMQDKDFGILEEVFSQWLPFYDKHHIKLIVKQLPEDIKYREALHRLFRLFKLTSGKEYVENLDRIGEKTVYLSNIIERFGEIVGRIVFELLALSNRLRGMIISFGQRLAGLARKLKITVLTVHSEYKRQIKQHAKIRSLLRISLYAITTESLHELISDLQISGLDLNLAVDIAGLGVFMVADG